MLSVDVTFSIYVVTENFELDRKNVRPPFVFNSGMWPFLAKCYMAPFSGGLDATAKSIFINPAAS